MKSEEASGRGILSLSLLSACKRAKRKAPRPPELSPRPPPPPSSFSLPGPGLAPPPVRGNLPVPPSGRRYWCKSKAAARLLAERKASHRAGAFRRPPPAGFAGKLPYYCDAEKKTEKPRARPGPARPSLARCQAASPAAGRRRSRCGVERGAGAGIVGWKAARGTRGGRSVAPGAAVSARQWLLARTGPGSPGTRACTSARSGSSRAPAPGTTLRGAEGAGGRTLQPR